MALNVPEVGSTGGRGEKATAATLVYRRLRQDILKGELKPGQKLQIEQVATRYGVGANPVREALNRLSSEHLVDRHDQRGFFVPELSLEKLRELVRTRCWLEGKALEESIANRTQIWEDNIVLSFHRLSRTRIQTPEEGGDNTEWEIKHRAFHNALIGACGSFWLIKFCNEMMDQAERYRYISMSGYPRRDSVEEHRLIMEAALDGDAELAKQRLFDQYNLTLKHLEAQIEA
ncbi:GntR family transcriptional regulator [Mesorhizobium microcysteis]|uniref:GntR family transcriptional regulator n=1 Tax=Neoaquamicrobium microcysteis TaxID=2682781 RepID=A0A5D4GX85_9HYPH|nr:GntR family transcriptional regulator [Mesorhizobium microcysteis]TYR33206.1 GntR family transcriptional regulator [Mesorhizobium microcysteis]